MKTFKELLSEASSSSKLKSLNHINIVYHVTNFDNAKNILTHNYFRPSKNSETGKKGLSTTFDKNYNWGGGGIKFVLDLKKLGNDFRVSRVDTLQTIDDESEIIIFSESPIINIHKYIIDIQIIKNNDNSIKTTKKDIQELIINYKSKNN